MRQRAVILALFASIVLTVGAVGWYRQVQRSKEREPVVLRPAVVRCQPLSSRSHEVAERFYGLVEPRARVDMAFQIPGRLSKLGVESSQPAAMEGSEPASVNEPGPVVETLRPGRIVQPGQVIARLEPMRFEAMVEQAKAQLAEARASQSGAEAEVARAGAALRDAEREARKVRELVERGASTQRELERLETHEQMARAAYEAARAKVAAALASASAARAAMTMAEVNLSDTVLTAPMHARVAAVPAEVGQMVPAGAAVAVLVDIGAVKLVLGVVESRLPMLRVGQTVKVRVRALRSDVAARGAESEEARSAETEREGVVTIVPPAADARTGLFNVEVELSNDDDLLRPGMIGEARVVVDQRRAVAIPSSAVERRGDRLYAVFVSRGLEVGLDLGGLGRASGTVRTPVARRLPLTVIGQSEDRYLVIDLPEDVDRVVVEGQSRLVDGQPVSIVGESSTGERTASAPTEP